MDTNSTNELITALQTMLSKNSDRFSTEEVASLNEAIAGLIILQALQENPEKDKSSELKGAMQIQLLKTTGSLLRFFMHSEVIKFINDILN